MGGVVVRKGVRPLLAVENTILSAVNGSGLMTAWTRVRVVHVSSLHLRTIAMTTLDEPSAPHYLRQL